MEKIYIVTTTFSTKSDAESAAKKILHKRLAACVQISDKITSMYWWKDTIAKEEEYVLTAKTREKISLKLQSYLKEIHPYETPEILTVGADHCHGDYLNWLIEETSAGE